MGPKLALNSHSSYFYHPNARIVGTQHNSWFYAVQQLSQSFMHGRQVLYQLSHIVSSSENSCHSSQYLLLSTCRKCCRVTGFSPLTAPVCTRLLHGSALGQLPSVDSTQLLSYYCGSWLHLCLLLLFSPLHAPLFFCLANRWFLLSL